MSALLWSLPYPPCTTNHMYATVRSGRRVLKAIARNWRDGIIATIRDGGQPRTPPGLVSVAEAAKWLGLHHITLRRRLKEGVWPSERVAMGRDYVIGVRLDASDDIPANISVFYTPAARAELERTA